ncbi:uncharacterized protein LOC141643742 isoform X2 [Silene latifolia]|uniref:uncharacterized protein LOC141643742 isoform X2 n=1 Tax=Silene latifolia TaxID=37657 RepID=UPI003D776F12
MVCRNPPWSDLPQELLSTIANTLTSDPISIRTFRSICRSWRSSCPPLPHSSILSPFLPLSILSAPSALVPAQEFGTYMKNCILFVKNSFRTYSGYDDDYKDFPKLKNSELDIGVWHLDDTDHAIESYPHYSDLLWPPPSWIWNIDRLNRIGIVETAVDEMLLRVGGHIKTKFVIERPVDSLDTILQIRGQIRFMEAGRVALEVGTDVINLRIRVNAYSKEETEFMHGLRESMEILNKVDNLFQQSGGTSSHGTTKERLGSPHNFKTSPTCQDHLRLTMSKLCTRYACLFSIEEKVTEVEMYLKSLLGPLPTQ